MTFATTHTIHKVALTGGIASGKSLAGDYLQQKGVPVIDADQVVHNLLAQDPDLHRHIRQTFGEDVFVPSGGVDRQKLGAKVFGNTALRKQLESWIHPKVRQHIERFFQQHRQHPIGVALIPLLFESGLERHYDEVWLIETPAALQIQRLIDTRQLTREQALARIHSQMPLDEKRRRAQQHPRHALIDNQGDQAGLFRQIDRLLEPHQPKHP